MTPRALLASLLLLMSGPVPAQPAAREMPVVPEKPAAASGAESERDFRDTTGYRYPALSRTQRDLQNLAYALQLRDYCADDRVSDEFVKAQLERFSRITGRSETCSSLLAY